MSRHIRLLILALAFGILGHLWVFMQVRAQIDAFTFFIPYYADDLNAQFNVNDSYTGTEVEETISISILRDGTIVYYDHWEDGLEASLTFPTQTTTEVWGDGDPTNGTPPNIPGDVLNANDVIVLQNTVSSPRDPAVVRFDGGDKLTAVGGNIAVTLAAWPANPPGPGTLYAGAWEFYPTSRWNTGYIIPVGEDLVGERPGFEVVGLNVQAVVDNTSVDIDLDRDGTPETTVVLDQGEEFTQLSGVVAGTEIQASNPVQVHVFTSDPDQTYEARAYTMVPLNQWTNDYLAPRSSDGNYWLYNPDTSSALTVEVATSIGPTTTVTIDPGGTARYPAAGTSVATGVRFISTDGRPFYGLAALDPDSAQDWGYSLVPMDNLTTQSLIGWAPGNINTPPNDDQSRVYVTALNTTTLTVDYGTGITATFTITPLVEVPITAPNNDMTGSFLYTTDGTLFTSVWGQDQSADAGSPSIDVGTNIAPLATLAIQKTLNLVNDADGTGTITWGDTVEFTLLAYNNSTNPLNNAVIEDTLPPSLSYVANTSTVRGSAIADDGTGATVFPFDEGGYNVGTIDPLETIRITFQTVILENYAEINNQATVNADNAPPPIDPGGVIIPLSVARYELDKRLISPANGLSAPGEIITFGLTITSTGNISITRLPLQDTFNEDHLSFLQSIPAPDITAAGVITWSDLATTTRFGPLNPGRAIDLTVAFTVDQIPASVLNTTNMASVVGAEGSDGILLPPADDPAEVFFQPLPAPDPDPDPGPGDDRDDDDDDDDDSPSAAAQSPPAAPQPPPTQPAPVTLPVEFLPETGLGAVETSTNQSGWFVLPLLAVGFTTFYFWKKHRKS